MGRQVKIPWDVGQYLVERHGRSVYVVSKKDWDRVRRTLKRYPEAYEKLKALGVILSPVLIRGGQSAAEVVARRELARRRAK